LEVQITLAVPHVSGQLKGCKLSHPPDERAKKSGDTREEEGAAAHPRSFREEEERPDLEAMFKATHEAVSSLLR
jgi:hypothetical protein